MHNRREESKEKVIEIIKDNDISKLKKCFLKGNIFYCDFLVIAIENGASIEIIEFLLNNAKIKTLNYVFSNKNDVWKTPLSLAIEHNNFKIADLLIQYGANIYNIPITTFLFNSKNIIYILSKGVNNEFLQNLIYHLILQNNENSNVYLKKIFNYFIFDTAFILNLLSLYKKRIQMTHQQLNNLISKEKGKIVINKNMYSQAVYHNNFETINLIYNNDIREPDIILNEFASIFDITDFRYTSINSKEFIDKFKNNEINIPVDKNFLDSLNQFHYNRENLLSFEEIRKKLKSLIQQNSIEELNNYLEERHIQMSFFSEKYSPQDDLLFYAIKNNVFIKMLNFIIQNAQYKDLNYIIYEEEGKVGTLLSYTLTQNKLKYFDFLIKKGAKVNNEHVDLLKYLYVNKLLSSKNLKYVLNNDYKIELDIINQMIVDKEVNLLKGFFKLYTFGNSFILKLLSYYKNQTKLTDNELNSEISKEQNKLEFNELLYESAIEDKNFEILNLLYDNDIRPKEVILNELFHILDTAELNHEGIKQEFTDYFRKGNLKIPLTEHYINNLCNIETIRKFIIERIQDNDINELKNYINLNQLSLSNINNDYFDILIYAIKFNASIEIIKYIIPYYKTLNYTIHKYESPLFCAIYNNKFSIAHLLLKKGADFNFIFNNLGIFYKRFRSKFYSENKVEIFKYILSHGFITINSKFIISLIRYNENEFLKMIFKYYIFDDIFILNLLSAYKNKIKMSKSQLKKAIIQEKEKFINFECINEALCYNNEVLEIFFNSIDKDKIIPLKLSQIFRLLDEAIRRDNTDFIKSLLSFKLPNFDKSSFLKMGKYLFTNKCHDSDIMKHIIKRLLDNESNNLKDWDITKVLLHKDFRVDNNIELIKTFIQYSLLHPSFDFESIHFEDLLVILSEYNDKSLIKFTIEKSLLHPTFNFDTINFNVILILLNSIDISILKFFIKNLFNCTPPKHSIIKTVLLTCDKLNNNDLVKYIIDCIFDNDTLNFNTNINIQKLLLISANINSIENFNYIIDKIISHKSLELNDPSIERILMALCKIMNITYIDTIIKNFFNDKLSEINIFESKEINFEKIIATTIYHNNTYYLKYLLLNIINTNDINSINFEKYLLISNKINNVNAIKLLIEKIFNVSFDEPEFNENNIDLSIVKTIDGQYFSLIINSLIRLHKLNMIIFLKKNDEFKDRINMNEKDRNGDYPIIVSLYVNNVEISEYLIENGANCNVDDINNVSLLSLTLQNGYYCILRKLISNSTFMKTHLCIYCNSPLENAIYHNQLDKIKALNNEQNNSSLDISNHYFTPLSMAYLLNHTEIFEYLIQNCDVNELDYNGYTILHYAILKEDTQFVQKLLDLGSNVNYQRNKFLRGHSAIDICLIIKNMDILSMLLNHKDVLVNDPNSKGDSFIKKLIKMDNYTIEEKIDIIKLFIEKDSKINISDKEELTLLDYAFDNDSLLLMTSLLQNFNETEHDINIIKYLIDNKSNIDISSSDQAVEAMIYVIKSNHFNLFQYLMHNNLDINRKDKNGKTLLIYAIEAQNKEFIQYLLSHDADIDSIYIDIDIELYKKIVDINHTNLYNIIYNSKSFDIEQKDDQGNTALTYALKHGDQKIVQYLIDQEVDVNKEGKDNELPLTLSTRFNDIDLLKQFIEKGAEINKGDQLSDTALIGAIENSSDLSMVKFLIECKADVNKKGKHGDTPLAVAVYNNNIEMVKYLMENHADINEKCDDGDSLIDIAMINCNHPMVQYLIDANKKSLPGNIPLLDSSEVQRNREIEKFSSLRSSITSDESLFLVGTEVDLTFLHKGYSKLANISSEDVALTKFDDNLRAIYVNSSNTNLCRKLAETYKALALSSEQKEDFIKAAFWFRMLYATGEHSSYLQEYEDMCYKAGLK